MNLTPGDKDPRSDEAPTRAVSSAPDPVWKQAGPMAARLAEEMAAAWRVGERPLVEDLLARDPSLRTRPEVVLRLLCEEVCLRQEAGERLRAAELADRFPELQDEIENLLSTRGQFSSNGSAAAELLPAPALADFELIAELGQGAQGRVYLARQHSLADRPVVLKVTGRRGREHLSLARLQHTHIVPLYWVQDAPEHDRRTLCMPYFGNLTLAALLPALRKVPPARRRGRDILEALDRTCAASLAPLPARGPARQALARVSYAQAVAWMGACLAEALAYAHERGLLHLDVKPSNILLAADGQPMLLDFHLAQGPVRPDGPPPQGLGGTPLYMAPEQRAALEAVTHRQPIPAGVDERADIYALGLVLYQALGGSLPLPSPHPPRLEHMNEQVSPGLADVVHRCLAGDPRGRYQDAGALAADLRRHLADLPLRGVPNRSWAERWRKWRRRRPHMLFALCLLTVALAVVGGGGLWYARQRDAQTQARLTGAADALREGHHLLRGRQYAAAVVRLESGRKQAEGAEGGERLAGRLEASLRQARRLASAAELHTIADLVRFWALAEKAPVEKLRKLEKSCRALWDQRARILAFQGGDAGQDKAAQQVRADLLDLAVLGADLRVRLAPADRAAAARGEALRLLEQAEEAFGPNAVLLRQREELARALGRGADARGAAMPPQTAWEHSALGRRLLQAGELEKAAAVFDRAVALAPGEFWPNFYQGVCAFRRGKFRDAVAAFRTCIALQPDSAPAYNNRGLAYARLGERERARSDYTRALQLDPNLEEAARNLALLPRTKGSS
jgi:serine/threonine protein kinase/tetratricopeptide (TPR) repeat protein